MRKEILLLAAFLVLASVVQAKYSQTLTASDLLRIAHEEKEDVWFIKFYGQNCGFCKSMADEWERFAKMVHDEDLDLKVGEIDVHDPAIQQGGNDIRQLLPGPLPGLHLFPVGDKKFYEFPNPRIYADADGYLNFALFDHEKATASFRKAEYMYEEATEITNIDGATFYEDILESQKPVYLMIYGPKCGWCKTFMPTWEEFAKQAKEKNAPYAVGRMDGFTNLQLVDSVVARPWPSIIYYQPDGKYYRIDTDLVRENMNAQFYFDWIDEKTYLEADDEHSGQDSGIERFTKLRKAKEESKKRKQQKAAEKKDL